MAIVYKYGSIGDRSEEGAIDYFLKRRTLRFASAASQNDIYEAVPNLGRMLDQNMRSVASQLYPTRAKLVPRWEAMTEEVFAQTLFDSGKVGTAHKIAAVRVAWKVGHAKFRRFGVLSLTKRADNLLMWAHYAGGKLGAASGLCIGFDADAARLTSSRYEGAGLVGIQEVTYSATRADFEPGPLSTRLAKIVLTKSLEWSYECELRCVRDIFRLSLKT
jgi:hypothetical protein